MPPSMLRRLVKSTLLAMIGFAVGGHRPSTAAAATDLLPDDVVTRIGSMRMRHGDDVRTLAFSPDGKSIISASSRGVRIWETATGKLRRRFDVPTDWCLGFAFHSDHLIVANAGLKTRTITVQVVDPVSGKVRKRIDIPDQLMDGNLVFSREASGSPIATAKAYGYTIRLAGGRRCAFP